MAAKAYLEHTADSQARPVRRMEFSFRRKNGAGHMAQNASAYVHRTLLLILPRKWAASSSFNGGLHSSWAQVLQNNGRLSGLRCLLLLEKSTPRLPEYLLLVICEQV